MAIRQAGTLATLRNLLNVWHAEGRDLNVRWYANGTRLLTVENFADDIEGERAGRVVVEPGREPTGIDPKPERDRLR